MAWFRPRRCRSVRIGSRQAFPTTSCALALASLTSSHSLLSWSDHMPLTSRRVSSQPYLRVVQPIFSIATSSMSVRLLTSQHLRSDLPLLGIVLSFHSEVVDASLPSAASVWAHDFSSLLLLVHRLNLWSWARDLLARQTLSWTSMYRICLQANVTCSSWASCWVLFS